MAALTLRERGDMGHYRPSFVQPDRPDKSPTVVRPPSGALFDVTDPGLAAELWPEGARVIRQDRGVFDTFPISLITTQTIARLGELVGARLGVERFRPNMLNPASTERNPEILRMVAQRREGCLGVYGSTVEPGRVAMDDAVLLEGAA